MKITFDTFDNIKNFTPNMIPVSISSNPPSWYFQENKEEDVYYYINQNGIICGLESKELQNINNYNNINFNRIYILCENTINLLQERMKFKKEGIIVFVYNQDENIDILKEYLDKNNIQYI